MDVIQKTRSLCPACLKHLDAEIYEEEGKVWIRKECPEHGEVKEIYWSDSEMFRKAMKFAHDGKGIDNPNTETMGDCPQNCGLCKNHKSHTALGNIVITNRCDLACFYCFFYAKAMGYVYEPTLEQIRDMLRLMRQEKPVRCTAVQFTGGEPLLRDDILDIIKTAKEEGYRHVQLNTNGIKLSQNPELVRKIRQAGVNTIYLSFDGTTPETNPKNHWEVPFVLENARKVDLGIVLVPTVIRGTNDFEVGNILKFGIKNIDVVRGVNYQPVSLVGRMTNAERKRMRITIPDVIKKLEETGIVSRDDFFPVPTVSAVTHFIEAFTGTSKYELSTHSACGMATYLFKEGDKIIPLPRFLDVEGFVEYLNEVSDEIKNGANKYVIAGKGLYNLGRFIDKSKQPKSFGLVNLLYNVLIRGKYSALREIHKKSLFIGLMHFMDLYNYDIQRVERCCIHYAQPNGTIIPFCSFNVIPEWYRDRIQKEYGVNLKQWEKANGRNVADDLYKRDVKKLESDAIYRKTYEGFI